MFVRYSDWHVREGLVRKKWVSLYIGMLLNGRSLGQHQSWPVCMMLQGCYTL